MPIEICDLSDERMADAIDVWVRSRWAAEPWLEERMGYSDEQNDSFFRDVICAQNHVRIAVDAGSVVGLIAMANEEVDQLFIAPERQREGIGKALLDEAKRAFPERLRLYTHQRNDRARRFYEKEGFTIEALGVSAEPECEPDVRYLWEPSTRG